MHQRGLFLMVLAFGTLSVPAPVAAQTPCDPPTKICNGGDGITYDCPPCRRKLAASSEISAALALESYRKSLEEYRRRLESQREREPGGSLEGYREGMASYREGIDGYREDQAAARTPETGER